jgi:hypothetical protein
MTTPDTPDGPPRSVNVHVASAAEGIFPGSQENRKFITSVFRTFVLIANTPLPILNPDRSRIRTTLIAVGNSIVLCASENQAQDPANQIAAAGAPAMLVNTPANPDGCLLFVPVITGGGGTSERWPLASTETVWAVSMAAAVLAVTIENRASRY